MGGHAVRVAVICSWIVQFTAQAEDPSRRAGDADWARGLCSRSYVDAYTGTARSFERHLPLSVLERCKKQTPSKGSWIWEGRNWCWEAVKRRACYGHHSWQDAQRMAAEDKEAPRLEDLLLPALQDAERCDVPKLGASLEPDPPSQGLLLPEREDRVQDEQKYVNYQIEAHEAEFWFQRHVAVYVLNLPTATDRWSRISRRLEELQIHAVRVPGIDLSGPGAIQQAQEEGLVPLQWNFSAAKQNMVRLLQNSSEAAARRYLDNYGRGTVGCAAAHLRAMWQAASNAHRLEKPLALILEDDVMLEDDFKLKLRRLLRTEAPCDWEVISLRSQCPYGVCVSPHLTRVQPDANEPEEMCRHGVNYGFYAMVYRADSLISIANKLHQRIWDEARPGCLANDVALASLAEEVVYYAVPSSQAVCRVFSGEPDRNLTGHLGALRNHASLAFFFLLLMPDPSRLGEPVTATVHTTTAATVTAFKSCLFRFISLLSLLKRRACELCAVASQVPGFLDHGDGFGSATRQTAAA
ncbi:unnamed protein product [Symbiodinium natans]|uniref:Glycosyl transferase family 25 domain-containing protein n=1 Tax=Symbiodinium natans TaxID=878477 RepID=A0A812KUX7_9DINO|nr:unnamed protein product [Symbiodinium natans]